MSKIIIKLNAFLNTKEMTNVYNFIYDQYQKRDIIFVPNYCDVYVADGDSELKIEKFDAKPDFTDNPDMIIKLMKDGDWSAIEKAFKLRDEGKSLNEIAKELGYSSEEVNDGKSD